VATEIKPDEGARQFAAAEHPMLIGADWVEAADGRTFDVYDPSTGDVLGRVARGGSEDIDRAVKTARAAFDSGPWSTMTASERGRAIHRLGDLVLEHGDELATLEALDNGKPLGIARVADVPSPPTSSTTCRAGQRRTAGRRCR
jgi:phenylacetaldehyde dehydrogenase